MDAHKIVQRFNRVEADRRVVMQQWDDIRELVVPFRGDMWRLYTSETTVDWRENRNVYDSTAIVACQRLASMLHGSLTSPAIQWFELAFRDKDLLKDKASLEWLQAVSDLAFTALQESNFNLEVNESYLDMCSFGTAALIQEDVQEDDEKGWEGTVFTSIPVRELYFEEDIRGKAHILYRKIEMTLLQMVLQFGLDGIPENLREKYQNNTEEDTRYDCLFCIYERLDKPEDDGTIRVKEERRFGSKWVLRDSGEVLGEEGGYYSMPVYILRWGKCSGSKWGISPAHLALPDIKTLNTLHEMQLDTIEKGIDPTILVHERASFGDLNITAGAQNVVKDINGIKAFHSEAEHVVTFDKIDQLQDSIRSTFLIDQLVLKDSPAMTAYEVRTRYQQMQQVMSPTLGRLESDFLDPMILRTINSLHRAGALPEPPELVREAQAEMDIEFVGSLSQAQKVEQVQVIDQYIGAAVVVSEVKPEVLDLIDFDQAYRTKAVLMGVPADMLNGEDEMIQMREERQAQVDAMNQAALAEQTGKGGKAMGEAAKIEQEIEGQG